MKKIKVNLTKMNTEIGLIPVLSYFQKVNRPIQIFAAERQINNCNESIFFIVRSKDAIRLKEIGYNIQSIVLKPGYSPVLLTTGKFYQTNMY